MNVALKEFTVQGKDKINKQIIPSQRDRHADECVYSKEFENPKRSLAHS